MCAAFVDVVSPITRPTPASRQASAIVTTVLVLPVPAGADQDVDGPARGEHAVGRLRLVIGQPSAAQRRLCAIERIGRASRRGGLPCSRHSRASTRARSAPSAAAARSGASLGAPVCAAARSRRVSVSSWRGWCRSRRRAGATGSARPRAGTPAAPAPSPARSAAPPRPARLAAAPRRSAPPAAASPAHPDRPPR